jgi:hypothetical protein
MKRQRIPLRAALAIATLTATTLAACGGGDDQPSPSNEASPEGVYGGTHVVAGMAGSEARMLLLEDGQMWTLYGSSGADGFRLQGFLHAKGTYKSGTYTAADLINYGAMMPSVQSLSATYDTSRWTWTGRYGDTTLSGVELPSGLLDYHKPARLADVAGAWTLESYNNAGAPAEGLSLTVSTAGAISGSMSGGCPFSGQLTPRASGKNLFDATLTFATVDLCVFKGQTVTGIAITHLLAGNASRRQLLIGGHAVAATTVGMAAFGVRQAAVTP